MIASLTILSLAGVWQELAAVHNRTHAERLFVVIDSSNTGEISREDWCAWFEELAATSGSVMEFQLRYMERNSEQQSGENALGAGLDNSDEENEDEMDAAVAGAAAAHRASQRGSSGPKRPLEEQVQHLFNLIDEDGGGTIDEEEMARAYGEDSVLLMHRMELDENGEVGLEAWQRFWLQEMAQENAAMRDHLMATLELNVAETQVKDRKKRRMFYRTAKQRHQEGYSARYSSRPLAAAEAKDGVSMKAQARAATQALLKVPRLSTLSTTLPSIHTNTIDEGYVHSDTSATAYDNLPVQAAGCALDRRAMEEEYEQTLEPVESDALCIEMASSSCQVAFTDKGIEVAEDVAVPVEILEPAALILTGPAPGSSSASKSNNSMVNVPSASERPSSVTARDIEAMLLECGSLVAKHAVELSQEFESQGYDTWQDLRDTTKDEVDEVAKLFCQAQNLPPMSMRVIAKVTRALNEGGS